MHCHWSFSDSGSELHMLSCCTSESRWSQTLTALTLKAYTNKQPGGKAKILLKLLSSHALAYTEEDILLLSGIWWYSRTIRRVFASSYTVRIGRISHDLVCFPICPQVYNSNSKPSCQFPQFECCFTWSSTTKRTNGTYCSDKGRVSKTAKESFEGFQLKKKIIAI